MHLDDFVRQPGVLTEMKIPDGFRLTGWVYILSNEYMPGIYKIGMTTTSPETRAKELSSATGVPTAFKVEAAYHCYNPAQSERELHEDLGEFRINDSREFFQCDLQTIKYACEQYCEAMVGGAVEDLAMNYDVITFEDLNNLDLEELYIDVGLSVFGSKLAAAERLIRIGAEYVTEKLNKHGISIVFHDSKAFAVEDCETTFRRKWHEEKEAKEAAGIYGPQPLQKVIDPNPIPF